MVVARHFLGADWLKIVFLSCLGLSDLLSGHANWKMTGRFAELWEIVLRVRDDIKESVRLAAHRAVTVLQKVKLDFLVQLAWWLSCLWRCFGVSAPAALSQSQLSVTGGPIVVPVLNSKGARIGGT